MHTQTIPRQAGVEVIRNDNGTLTFVDHDRGVERTFNNLQESIDDDLFGEFSDYGRPLNEIDRGVFKRVIRIILLAIVFWLIWHFFVK